ncbi:hypothetical protein CRM22_008256 [Opisthorchis felineus]|uniref:Ion transport domain-containing protein n=1 Tax=Opisthorchis felineus TaxID=147828 RepID=A0A4S2LC12_OPIFE|nr:hypothetical protein CRM22_008256 [Opisthorchis felineus]TGZ60956.1 hypothetical protein CRM22_008256 [Opisthorchis felineus]TGZ60958.1 hypothetical protein CRM22_008256 [Opisthorchis felineus]TGZ60959.1 hypothetical protein CRM22_008256 [Opisthorchis felineus]
MAPLFLAFYMLLAGILLINLLIAIFSNVFQDVEQISVQLWKHNRFALVFANKLATVLPVPLSIFEIMTELFCYLCSVHNQIPTSSRRSRTDPLRIPMFKEEIPMDPLRNSLSDDELIRRFETACTYSYLQSRQADGSPQVDPNLNYVKNRQTHPSGRFRTTDCRQTRSQATSLKKIHHSPSRFREETLFSHESTL